jgi:LAS superfamily LD-carboxypeptidase LdcB
MRTPYANSAPLNPLELTGRASSHVRKCTEPPCALHCDALVALQAMRLAALDDGIEILPVSSFRDFEHQLRIWNAKYRGERILRDRDNRILDSAMLSPAARVAAILAWSALPGASRHHWGSDCDLIDRRTAPVSGPIELLGEDFAAGGRYAALNDWLEARSADFGFFRPYDRDRGGVQPEPWHLSYAPVAAPALAAMSPALLRTALAEVPLAGAEIVAEQLPTLFDRYVVAVAEVPHAARYARALSRAARPV